MPDRPDAIAQAAIEQAEGEIPGGQPPPRSSGQRNGQADAPVFRPVRERLGEIDRAPIEWLWRPWLARSQFHLIAAPPGIGKTSLAIELAARLTRGKWPFKREGRAVLICLEDTWRYRLAAQEIEAGGDRERVEVIRESVTPDGHGRRFRLEDDLPALTEDLCADSADVDLIVLDPVIRAIGNTKDSHNATQVRGSLDAVEQLARRSNTAGLGITHFNKPGNVRAAALDRIMGSSAWAQVARVIWRAWEIEESHPGSSEYQYALGMMKNNLGPDIGMLPYDIVESEGNQDIARIQFGQLGIGSANSILDNAKPGKLEQAQTWLCNHVQPGQTVHVRDLKERAENSGHASRTLDRARDSMGWQTGKDGAAWTWTRPE